VFTESIWQASTDSVLSMLRKITAILQDSDSQWMVYLCLGIYFISLLLLRWKAGKSAGKAHRPAARIYWLLYLLAVGSIGYAIQGCPSMPALIFLAGVVIGQGIVVWMAFNVRLFPNSAFRIPHVLLLFLCLASVWNTGSHHSYEYATQVRWTGPWDNPNIFGLLMGTGIVLAIGQIVLTLKPKIQRRETGPLQSNVTGLTARQFLTIGSNLLAVILLACGLFHSYSRGAWLATFCGLAYLACQLSPSISWKSGKPAIPNSEFGILHLVPSCVSRVKNNWLPIIVILFSAGILLFWHFRQTDWHPARRVLSSVNPVDFSWRNRVVAWEGALQISSEHPWFGAGWNQPRPLYEHYYLPPRLQEGAAIEMNDYLLLAATLGIPTLLCFVTYLGLSLTVKGNSGKQKAEADEVDWLQASFRAGAIVLLIGLWFDGGLFKLSTAAVFWVLLELGSAMKHEMTRTVAPVRKTANIDQ